MRTLLIVATKHKDFATHLHDNGYPLCGMFASDPAQLVPSSQVPNWGAVLCPRCRLLLDEEHTELARLMHPQPKQKPPARSRGP